MKRSVYLGAVALVSLIGSMGLIAQAEAQIDPAQTSPTHVLLNASDLAWSPAKGLPAGAEIAVLEGDPSKEGPFTLRARMPEGYKIAPHRHPGVEHVTVISGTFHLAAGETMDMGAGKVLTAGGFAAMPPKMPHSAWVDGETVIQLHGMGPWGITYVNPADDPRNEAQ